MEGAPTKKNWTVDHVPPGDLFTVDIFALVSRGSRWLLLAKLMRKSALFLNFHVVGVCTRAGPSPTSHLAMGIFPSQILMVALAEPPTSA